MSHWHGVRWGNWGWDWVGVTREKGGGGGTEYKWFYSLHALYPASPVTRLGLGPPGSVVGPSWVRCWGEGGGWGAKIKYFAATKLAELIQNNGKSNAKGFEQCFGLSFRSVCDTWGGLRGQWVWDRDNNSTISPEKLCPVNIQRLSGLE